MAKVTLTIVRTNNNSMTLNIPRNVDEMSMSIELLSLEDAKNVVADIAVNDKIVCQYIKRGNNYYKFRKGEETPISGDVVRRILQRASYRR